MTNHVTELMDKLDDLENLNAILEKIIHYKSQLDSLPVNNLNDEQKQTAANLIAQMDASGKWPGPVVTEVVASGDFWDAEAEHQDVF